ncbi:uncharacterized protein F4822DRAFT_39208 [Hypoxylon trugodes]|uniref:uncharacterized protein n=1 Tax=Hypoxylon trugodes TaxID=326681 RepID=UPI00219FD774|nr:uncharacterized protein F4822DRAFT_39208 [Hypoxylon trugodes]KAI1394162.1 hypothetical protein F4822DRAFT_39208 [Hypoxylon trugodes]
MANELVCANCSGVGSQSCSYCRLVLYCNSNCQRLHWPTHKADCRNNPLLKPNWRPRWETEYREPAFMGGPRLQVFNYQMKYLWGNMPAFDLLNIPSNEGVDYAKPLSLLFAASGDIRNVVKTITSLPKGFRSPMSIYLNDRDGDVVGRNAIMLLLALAEDDSSVVVENIVHLWYSAFIPQSLYDILRGKIHDLVQDVCSKIAHKAPNAPMGKTWIFGSRSLRLVLTKKQWSDLLASLEVPAGLTTKKAQDIRRAITIAPQRVDHRERRYFAQTPGDRASAQKFREDGIVIPFGASRDPFTVPNPTLFRNTSTWPLKDDAEPLSGWLKSEVLAVSTGSATNDVYGKLSFLLKDLLIDFHGRLKNMNVAFQLSNINAEGLSGHLGQSVTFDRIEVSNISDAGYLGMAKVIGFIGPLLKPRNENPHATLVALFLNAVDEIFDDDEKRKVIKREMGLVYKYLPMQMPTGPYDANIIISDVATQQIRDVDKYFNKYMQLHCFPNIVELSGMDFKKKHTIIDPWPMRLKKKSHQKGAKEEFDLLLSSDNSGCERYMEWQFRT